MSYDIGEVTEALENELSKLSVTSPRSQLILILQAFRQFTYVTAHSPTLPSLYLRHNTFSNPSIASPTSQLILQPFFRLSYVTGFSLTSPGEPPMRQRRARSASWKIKIYTEIIFLKISTVTLFSAESLTIPVGTIMRNAHDVRNVVG